MEKDKNEENHRSERRCRKRRRLRWGRVLFLLMLVGVFGTGLF